MDLLKGILIGTLYTALGFGLAFLFLHLGAMIMLGESGMQLIHSVDQGRMALHQTYMSIDPDNWTTRFLSDKVYYSICATLVLLVWLSNIFHQLNKPEEQTCQS